MDSLNRILGINWRTTILGIGVIVAAVGRAVLAFRSKNFDFVLLAEDGQLIATTLGGVLAGLGLIIAKDSTVTGAGSQAKAIDSTGVVTNVEGEVVGKQSAMPPQPKQESAHHE